jgi:hypothetical protein
MDLPVGVQRLWRLSRADAGLTGLFDMSIHAEIQSGTLTLKPTTFRLETEIMDALAVIRERDGIGVSEQVRRALKQWIAEKRVKVKSERKRAATRKRS